MVVRGTHRFVVMIAVALLTFIPISNATAFVPPRHPLLMNTYTLNGNGTRTTAPLGYLLTPVTGHAVGSLSGFKNTTLVSGVNKLKISTGTYQSMKVQLLYFTTTTDAGALVTVTTMMVETNAGYNTAIVATLTPKTDDLNLGDMFVLNTPNTLSGALTVLENGIATTYAGTSNATLRVLGQYYAAIGSSMKAMQGMIPAGLGTQVVSKVHAAVFDLSWACTGAYLGFAAAFAAYVAGCVTPLVVVVWTCVGALFALWSAEAAVNQECG
jgi:hypothetical protein